MMNVLKFTLILMVVGQVLGEPPECRAPEADDVEMLLETVLGSGPVS